MWDKNDSVYVPDLDQRYMVKDGRVVFQDGTSYSLGEALLVARGVMDERDLMILHLVKKIFDGEIESVTMKGGLERKVADFGTGAESGFLTGSATLDDLEKQFGDV